MGLDDTDRALLVEGVTRALTGAGSGVEADDALVALGWPELLQAEPHDAVELVFETTGRTGAGPRVLDDVVAAALGAPVGSAVVLPPFGTWRVPGRVDGTRLDVDGLSLGRHAGTDTVAVPLAEGWIDVPTAGLTITPIDGVDPSLGLAHVRADSLHVHELHPTPGGRWEAAVSRAWVAVGWQQVGTAVAMLDAARVHALERVQFDRPIASFQAVRHKLADTLVAVEAARETLRATAVDGHPLVGLAAGVAAGRAGRTAGRHAQQVLAGIGFTTEHAFPSLRKRSLVLDGLFGATPELTAELGRRLVAARSVPHVLDL